MRPPNSARLMRWRSGRMIGLPDILPDSFKKAMTEPVKVMAPMATPSDISMRLAKWTAPGSPMPNALGAYSAAAATNTAARPTSEWKAATSSGMAVMAMRRAVTAPTRPPTPRPTPSRIQVSGSCGLATASVVPMAMSMPSMPA